MAGFISSNLSNALISAWDDGTNAFNAFKTSVSAGLKQIVEQLLYNQIFATSFQQLKDNITASFGLGGDGQIIDDLQKFFSQAPALTQQWTDAMTAANAQATAAGFDWTSTSSRTATTKGIASLSQDTGNELNGRFTAIQGHTFSINEGMKILQSNSQQALQHLAGIETNTARLEAIQNGIDTINLKGIILKK